MRVAVAALVAPHHDVIGPLERAQAEVTVLRRVEDLAELLAVARSGSVDVLLASAEVEEITRALIDEVDSLDRPVGLVVQSEVPAERGRLRRLGVPALRLDADPLELAAALTQAARDAALETKRTPLPDAEGEPELPARLDVDADEPRPLDPGESGASGPAAALRLDDTASAAEAPSGMSAEVVEEGEPEDSAATLAGAAASPVVVAVWGPTGAPGRTTVAVNLAAEYALLGHRTVLVDADTYGPSVAACLGLLDDAAGLAQAARAADRGDLDERRLADCAARIRVAGAELSVLTGLSRPDRWPELRSSAVAHVLQAARGHWDRVVVDVGFCLEEDEELSFDIPAPQRNAATLAALRAADRILAVGGGCAVSLPRLMRTIPALVDTVGGTTQVQVVVNRVRSSTAGLAPQSQIQAAWRRFVDADARLSFLPDDPVAVDQSLLNGQVLAESAPRSSLRRALAGLAVDSGTPQADGAEARTRAARTRRPAVGLPASVARLVRRRSRVSPRA